MIRAEQLSEQAAVTDWPLRILLVMLTLAVILLAMYGLRRGWRNRGRRQGLVLPDVPADIIAAAERSSAVSASYIGTIPQGQLLERLVAAGTRAEADIVVADSGVLVDKLGDPPLFIGHDVITGLSTSSGMLQRHFGGHGLLMVDWVWADRPVSTGLGFPDPADQDIVRQRIQRVHLEGVS